MSVRAASRTLVARDAELAALGTAVERAASGDAATVIVSGDAGVGKTRLVDELMRTARDDGALVLLGRCVDVGDGELPFAPLRRVSIATPFSALKMAAIQALRYMPAARCYFQTRGRFWERDPLGPLGGLNLVGTDTMAGRVWNTSSQQADQRHGMVHAYMFDTEALEFAAHGHRRVAAMSRLMRRLLPGIRGQVVGVAHKAWQEDPWAGGGWGWTRPGDLRWMFPAMRAVEGRVHFAGEHTSLWIAWMNGALESAERVVGEILRADGEPRRAAGLLATTS